MNNSICTLFDNILIDIHKFKSLHYYMFSQIEKILKLAYGGAQPNISSKIICELQFLLPPLMEQKRIVQKIEELYSYFDNIQKALEA